MALRPNPYTKRGKCNFPLTLTTWKVRWLIASEKQQQLSRDCAKYYLGLTWLQEMKVAVNEGFELASEHKLVLIQQQTANHMIKQLQHLRLLQIGQAHGTSRDTNEL